MTRNEIVGLVVGLVSVAGLLVAGAVAFGRLDGKIEGLDPNAIREARDEAVAAITARLEQQQFPPVGTEWDWEHPGAPVKMIPVETGLCFLVHVSGGYAGFGEVVEIVDVEGDWVLRGREGRDGKDVRAKARCWEFPNPAS